jgi:hypothetical protein
VARARGPCSECGGRSWKLDFGKWVCAACYAPAPASAPSAKPDHPTKEKRPFGHWSRNPDAIIDDPNLGAAEKAVAAAIARKIHWGESNTNLNAYISQSELGRLAGIRSRHGVRNALCRLEDAGYVKWVSLPGRGGCRFWFVQK